MRSHPKRYKMCHNCKKKCYPSQVIAEDMAAYRMSADSLHVIAVYPCPVRERTWHITKSNMAARHRREGKTVE
jgi:hypothetical protein